MIADKEEINTDATDALCSTKKALEDSIDIIFSWKKKAIQVEPNVHAMITDLILQAYAYRAHVGSMLIEYQINEKNSLSHDHIDLIQLILEFCYEINNHNFNPNEL